MNSFRAKPDPTTKPQFGFENRVNCRPVSLSRFLRTALFRAVMEAILVCLFSWPTFADVQLHLKNGQVIHADQVGSETDRHRIAIVIVIEQSGISLTRYRKWSNIRSISIDSRLSKKSAVLKQFGAAEKNQPQFSLGEVYLVSPGKPTVSTISVSEIPPPNE